MPLFCPTRGPKKWSLTEQAYLGTPLRDSSQRDEPPPVKGKHIRDRQHRGNAIMSDDSGHRNNQTHRELRRKEPWPWTRREQRGHQSLSGAYPDDRPDQARALSPTCSTAAASSFAASKTAKLSFPPTHVSTTRFPSCMVISCSPHTPSRRGKRPSNSHAL